MRRKLDNSAKEHLGINYLETELLKTGIVQSNIPRGDKATSWDGSITVYSGVPFSKKALIDEIPVQVKCRTVESYTNRISISVDDMNNYLKKKKILYFVVELIGDNYKIYYKPLLLWDINKFLIDSNGQASMTTDFFELPLNDVSSLKQIINRFVNEASQQEQMIPDVFSMEDLVKKIPEGTVRFHLDVENPFSGQDIIKAIKKERPYLYYHSDNLGLNFVVDRVSGDNHFALGRSVCLPVKVDNDVLFDEYEIIEDEFGFTCKIGKYITGRFTGKNTTFNYSLKGTLDERIKTLLFAKGLFGGGKVEIGGFVFPVDNSIDRSEEREKIETSLNYYYDLKKLFNNIGIIKQLDLDGLNETQWRNLYDFSRSELYGEEVALGIGTTGVAYLRLGDVNILCYCKALENGKNYVFSAFHPKLLLLKADFADRKDKEVSVYSILVQNNINGFELIDNVNYNEMIDDLMSHLNDEYDVEVTVQILLKLIEYYDKYKHPESLLASITLSDKIYNHNPSDIYFINYCQSLKRSRDLTQDEKNKLSEIKDGTDDLCVKCGCSILLNAHEEAKVYYDKMNDETKVAFSSFPIASLTSAL